MTCEDFPCCGHEMGCCPDYNEDGEQINMICTCGAKLPINNRYSICDSCLGNGDDDYQDDDYQDDDYQDDDYQGRHYPEDFYDYPEDF